MTVKRWTPAAALMAMRENLSVRGIIPKAAHIEFTQTRANALFGFKDTGNQELLRKGTPLQQHPSPSPLRHHLAPGLADACEANATEAERVEELGLEVRREEHCIKHGLFLACPRQSRPPLRQQQLVHSVRITKIGATTIKC